MKVNMHTIHRKARMALMASFCAMSLFAFSIASSRADDSMPLPLKLPKPAPQGTPARFFPVGPGVEKPSDKPRPVPMVPKGTVNLAFKKKVTSKTAPFGNSSLSLVTDGNKEATDDSAVELKTRLQWIQIDLGETDPLSYIVVWHYHKELCVYHSVIVQLSNDPDFINGVTTIFNNDQENAAGLGAGKDREYLETNEGKLIDAKGTKARYVRLYSNGSTGKDKLNRYTEVEVYGVPSR